MKTNLTLLLLIGIAGVAVGAGVELGSLATRAGISGSTGSFSPAFSADGRFVVFLSQAQNLAPNDNHAPLLQVYRRDLTSNITELVSISTNGIGGANESAFAPSVSADGRFVAFESVAGNLAANDTNGVNDVFVRDMDAGLTLLASTSTNGVRSGNGPSRSPQISADGRYVAFESRASDLVTDDTNTLDDIFLRDLAAGTNLLISPAPVIYPHTRGNSSSPFLSAYGQVVAFENIRSNLASSFVSGDIYVRKLDQSESIFASATVTNYLQSAPQSRSLHASIDPSGRRVAFFGIPFNQSALGTLFVFDLISSNLTSVVTNVLAIDPPPLSLGGEWTACVQSNALYLLDLNQGTNLQVCGPAGLTNGIVRSSPVLSTNGSRLLFSVSATNNGSPVLLCFDRTSNAFTTISVNSNGTPAAVDLGSLPSLSDDGSRIAYVSSVADIVASDYNQDADVFWFDAGTSQTQLVSERAPGGVHSANHRIASDSRPIISANGRFLAFVSLDNELVPGDDNPSSDVFLRDLQSHTLERLVPTNRPPGATVCLRPAISEDGRFLAWLEQPAQNSTEPSQALTNIVWLDRLTGESRSVAATSAAFGQPRRNGPALSPDGRSVVFTLSGQVYLQDMSQPGTNSTRISASYIFPEYQLPASGESGNPQFTPDGQWVVFSSDAGGSLVSNALSFRYGIYARNLAQHRTKAVSVPPPSLSSPYTPSADLNFQVCHDSRHVLFTMATNGIRHTYLADLLTTNAQVLACSDCLNPSASVDGRFVAFDRQQAAGGPFNAYVRDLQTGLTELVSQRTDGTAATNGFACTPVISGDGRFVAYRGGDPRLVANDTNAAVDLFIRDRLLGFNFPITRQALDRSHYFSPGTFNFGSDGSTLLLSSQLPGLAAEDLSPSADVFLLRVGAADSDNDGIDDQWEAAYFDTIARDGSGDFDGDGSSDKAEFLAGTDPTNAGSTLPMLAISATSGSTRTVFWNAIPGRSYRVEFKGAVDAPGWIPVGAEVIAASTTASLVDSTIGTNTHRFYRARILP